MTTIDKNIRLLLIFKFLLAPLCLPPTSFNPPSTNATNIIAHKAPILSIPINDPRTQHPKQLITTVLYWVVRHIEDAEIGE